MGDKSPEERDFAQRCTLVKCGFVCGICPRMMAAVDYCTPSEVQVHCEVYAENRAAIYPKRKCETFAALRPEDLVGINKKIIRAACKEGIYSEQIAA